MRQQLVATAGPLIIGISSALAIPSASEYRAELEDVVFYQRLVEGGSGLAYKTYAAQERAFANADRRELAQAAALYQALAALELDKPRLAAVALDRYKWEGDSEWKQLGAKLNQELTSKDADPISIRQQRFVDTVDSVDIVVPALTLSAKGKVAVDYDFYDAVIFRTEAAGRTESLYRKVIDKLDGDSALVALWCEVFLGRYDDAHQTVQALKQLALDGNIDSGQVEELQCLGAALVSRTPVPAENRTVQVDQFLEGRLKKPPTSPWALRAMSLINGHTEQRLAVMHQSVATLSQNAHPFARQTLTNIPEQTERVLDCYWEVAWGHRCQAVAETGWVMTDALNMPSLRAKRLLAELLSPTVAESWRPRSVLRLEVILEANVLAGDAETWQLALTEEHLREHPILETVIQLSRTFSGDERARLRHGDIETLASDTTKDVAHLLLGNNEAERIASSQPMGAVESPRRAWTPTLAVLIVLGVVTAVILRRRRRGVAG